MRDMYGGDERSQKLKYHIQTSGRSLHAQEIDFNDIRTTLQALLAIQDNANSLHTNAYDEAITTPTEESVRRALAIQLIVNKESGWTKTENPMQGSFIVDELTELVEAAVLEEFEAISRRGGVLGAMETMYQRGKIQDESMYYEHLKHEGTLPIIGVNTFQNPNAQAFDESAADDFEMELARATPEEKQECLERVEVRQTVQADQTTAALKQLQEVARLGGNVFEELMETVKVASLGQITDALFKVGGQYRRNMWLDFSCSLSVKFTSRVCKTVFFILKRGEDYLMSAKWIDWEENFSGAKFVLQVKHPIGTGSPGPLAWGWLTVAYWWRSQSVRYWRCAWPLSNF